MLYLQRAKRTVFVWRYGNWFAELQSLTVCHSHLSPAALPQARAIRQAVTETTLLRTLSTSDDEESALEDEPDYYETMATADR